MAGETKGSEGRYALGFLRHSASGRHFRQNLDSGAVSPAVPRAILLKIAKRPSIVTAAAFENLPMFENPLLTKSIPSA